MLIISSYARDGTIASNPSSACSRASRAVAQPLYIVDSISFPFETSKAPYIRLHIDQMYTIFQDYDSRFFPYATTMIYILRCIPFSGSPHHISSCTFLRDSQDPNGFALARKVVTNLRSPFDSSRAWFSCSGILYAIATLGW